MALYYLESPSTDPAYNLALEQAVFDLLPREHSYFMLWQNANAIIVGKNQNTVTEINNEYVKEHDIKVIRRLSGGGAVYHDLGNINFTFIMNDGEAQKLNMRMFCEPVVRALAHFGVTAEISGRNDVTIDGKKFSGNAQYRREGRVMHHGTIMFDVDLKKVGEALNVKQDKLATKGVASVKSRVTNVKPYLSADVTLADFWQVLRTRMIADDGVLTYELSQTELAFVEELRQNRYDTWAWNYGKSPLYDYVAGKRYDGVGQIDLAFSVKNGLISAFASHGDYFGSGETTEFAKYIVGTPPTQDALRASLEGVPIDLYYTGWDRDSFIELLLSALSK